MRSIYLKLTILTSIIATLQLTSFGQQLVIKNVNVIQVQSQTVLANQDVVIQGDRIVLIRSSVEEDVLDDVEIVDGRGMFLMPGMIDSHVHTDKWATGAAFSDSLLYTLNGVTTVMNLRGDEEVLAIRDSLRHRGNGGLHPDLYTSGPFINRPYFESPKEVVTEVSRQQQLGYDFIKMHGDLSVESFRHLHERARALDIQVIGHAPRNLGMDIVFEEGQHLAHAEEFLYTSFSPSRTALWKNALLVGAILSLALLLLLVIRPFVWFVRRRRGKTISRRDSVWLLSSVFLSLVLLFGFLLSVPPAAPFFLNSNIARLVMIAANATLFWQARRMYRSIRGSSGRRRFVYGGYFSLAAVVCILGIYWNYLTFLTTDSNVENVAQEVADSGIMVCPNFIAYKTIADSHYQERVRGFEEREEMNYLTPGNRSGFLNRNDPMEGIKAFIAPGFEKQVPLLMDLVGLLSQKEVPLLAGTDTGIYWIFPGVSMHEELALMKEAGVDAWSILASATINGARFLGREEEFGDIREGLRADLVLLNGNPIEEITNISSIQGVMVRGRWLSYDDLTEMKQQILAERAD